MLANSCETDAVRTEFLAAAGFDAFKVLAAGEQKRQEPAGPRLKAPPGAGREASRPANRVERRRVTCRQYGPVPIPDVQVEPAGSLLNHVNRRRVTGIYGVDPRKRVSDRPCPPEEVSAGRPC